MDIDEFMLAYEAAIDAGRGGSVDEEIEALRDALSVAYGVLFPV